MDCALYTIVSHIELKSITFACIASNAFQEEGDEQERQINMHISHTQLSNYKLCHAIQVPITTQKSRENEKILAKICKDLQRYQNNFLQQIQPNIIHMHIHKHVYASCRYPLGYSAKSNRHMTFNYVNLVILKIC